MKRTGEAVWHGVSPAMVTAPKSEKIKMKSRRSSALRRQKSS
jgi:hypothetical protein